LPVVALLSSTAPSPKPVEPRVRSVPVAGVDEWALRSDAGRQSEIAAASSRVQAQNGPENGGELSRPAIFTTPRKARDFELLGVTWRASADADLIVVVRVHGAGGWSGWKVLEVASAPGKAEGALKRRGTEPLYTGPSGRFQVRVDVRSGGLPNDVRVSLIDPGRSRADAGLGRSGPAATAAAATTRPRIFSRAEWGADERLRGSPPKYSSTVKAGFVHHTTGANRYAANDVPRILRSIYAYHTKSSGWSDLGYNFLVDRFGRTWEGRHGGITRAVIGAHTGGFNTDTFGVAAIGDYSNVRAPSPTVESIGRLMAWKLSVHSVDPYGTTTLVSSGAGTSRYARGERAAFNVISAHRDAGNTDCPGALLAQLPTIRSLVSPVVDLSQVRKAIRTRRTSAAARPDVLVVEKALLRLRYLNKAYADGRAGPATRAAYARWQRALGFTGANADGLPGLTSLTRLRARFGFKVSL
jgi:hypothetical protein